MDKVLSQFQIEYRSRYEMLDAYGINTKLIFHVLESTASKLSSLNWNDDGNFGNF